MTTQEKVKIYKGTTPSKYIGRFRVGFFGQNESTTFPIELTQSDFDLLYDIEKATKGTQVSLEIIAQGDEVDL